MTLPEAPPAPAMSTPFGAQANLPAFDDTDDEHGDMPAFTKPQVSHPGLGFFVKDLSPEMLYCACPTRFQPAD